MVKPNASCLGDCFCWFPSRSSVQFQIGSFSWQMHARAFSRRTLQRPFNIRTRKAAAVPPPLRSQVHFWFRHATLLFLLVSLCSIHLRLGIEMARKGKEIPKWLNHVLVDITPCPSFLGKYNCLEGKGHLFISHPSFTSALLCCKRLKGVMDEDRMDKRKNQRPRCTHIWICSFFLLLYSPTFSLIHIMSSCQWSSSMEKGRKSWNAAERCLRLACVLSSNKLPLPGIYNSGHWPPFLWQPTSREGSEDSIHVPKV